MYSYLFNNKGVIIINDLNSVYNPKIIEQIIKSDCFDINKNKFHFVIGYKPYSKNRLHESKCLIIDSEEAKNSLYNDLSVSFIPKDKTYPASFIALFYLLFHSVDMLKIVYDKCTTKQLCMFLYNKGYVFLNSNSLQKKHYNLILNSAIDILVCGNEAEQGIKKLIKSKPNSVNCMIIIHPSGNNIDKPAYKKAWIEFDNSECIMITSRC